MNSDASSPDDTNEVPHAESFSAHEVTAGGAPGKTGIVRYVIFSQYVIANSSTGALSLIDVMDGMNVLSFPVEVRLFVVVNLENAAGDFQFSVRATVPGEAPVTGPSIYVPLQIATKRSNLAGNFPPITIKAPGDISFTLLADGKPFHDEAFSINQIQNPLQPKRV
jgi:hypothetical protein